MTLAQASILFGVFCLGIVAGAFLIALFMGGSDSTDVEDRVEHAANARDAELLAYLNKSECNLFFNPSVGAWGLLDGQDKVIAIARNVHTTLARAMDKDAQEVAHVGA